MRSQLYILIFLLMIGSVYAYPNLNNNRVSDFANILTAAEIQNLTTQIYMMENITGAQFALVTVLSTEGDDRTDYASHIGEQNGVGVTGKDNGVIILWSIDNEHGGAIATGRGVGDILTDVTVARIGTAHRPELDAGKYYTAFSGILTDIQNTFPNNNTVTNNTSSTTLSGGGLAFIIVLGIIVLLFIVIAAISDSDGGSGGGSGGFAGGYVGSSGGWSSGSSGGSSFGGGSFGGGGAHF